MAKPIARWTPRKMRGHELRRGDLTAADGKVLAVKITLKEARNRFPEYRVISNGARTWDVIDYRVPGSYGSRQ